MSDPSSVSNSYAAAIDSADRHELALVPSSPEDSEQFLRLHLLDMTILLPVQQLTEVLTIPVGQVIPVPHMPDWVMGVYNWRGEILWVVDLGHLCGLTPWHHQVSYGSTHAAIVLQIRMPSSTSATAKSQTLGLVVRQVGEIEWCNPAVIQPLLSNSLPPQLASLVRGFWWQPEGDMLAVLDGEAILKQVHKR